MFFKNPFFWKRNIGKYISERVGNAITDLCGFLLLDTKSRAEGARKILHIFCPFTYIFWDSRPFTYIGAHIFSD